MCRKHQVDSQPIEGRLHIVRAGAALGQLADAGCQRLRERLGKALELALAQDADTLPVFGDIGRVKIDAERARDGADLAVVQLSDRGHQFLLGRRGTRAALASGQADALHEFECPLADKVGNDLTQHVSQ